MSGDPLDASGNASGKNPVVSRTQAYDQFVADARRYLGEPRNYGTNRYAKTFAFCAGLYADTLGAADNPFADLDAESELAVSWREGRRNNRRGAPGRAPA